MLILVGEWRLKGVGNFVQDRSANQWKDPIPALRLVGYPAPHYTADVPGPGPVLMDPGWGLHLPAGLRGLGTAVQVYAWRALPLDCNSPFMDDVTNEDQRRSLGTDPSCTS